LSSDSPTFPDALYTADEFSGTGQSRTLRGTAARLGLTVVATLFLSLAPLSPSELKSGRALEPVGRHLPRAPDPRSGEWYTRKAAFNRSKAKAWAALLLGAEAAGVVLALLMSLSLLSIDLASFAAAVIAAGAAWLSVKQHEAIGAAA
jgi:hypothetical protein